MKFKRLMAVLLSMSMVVGMMPALVFAKEIDNAQVVKVSAEDSEPKEEETQKPEEEKKPEKEEEKKPASDSGKKTESEDKKTDSKDDKKTESEGDKKPESEPEDKQEPKEEEKPSTDDGKKTGDVDEPKSEPEGEEKPESDGDKKTEPESEPESKSEPEGEKKTESEDEAKPEQGDEKAPESDEKEEPKDEPKDGEVKDVDGPTVIYKEDKPSDNDELFKTFIENKLYGKKPSLRKSGTAGSKLTGINKICYDSLVPLIKKVAEGTVSSTIFEVDLPDGSYEDKYYTASDLEVSSIFTEENTLTDGVADNIYAKMGIDLSAINKALMADLPSEMYWFDKTVGVGLGSGFSYYEDSEIHIKFNNKKPLRFSFYVAKSYSKTNTKGTCETGIASQIARVNLAKTNAQAVVNRAKSKSDYEKLVYYRDQICSFVVYDDDAADDSTNTPYGDPWQLISVFDNDSTTNVVCEGYSKAFKYLCDLSDFKEDDIECITVSGFMTVDDGDPGRHMWNVVKMDDGKYYLVDVTNCDNGTIGNPSYLFLKGYSSGSYANGYIFNFKIYSVEYDYYDDTKNTYPSTWLTISSTDYVEPSNITTWAELQAALNAGGNIKLTQNITAGSGDTLLYTNKTVVLDLNGYIINRNLSTPTDDGGVIFVDKSGNLTITDSRPDATHSPAIKYKNLKTGKDVVVNGGIITGGYSKGHAGGIRFNWSTGTMNGGTIVGNKATNEDNTDNAGGVLLYCSDFTINGGTICGNEAIFAGNTTNPIAGGVSIRNSDRRPCNLNINSGTITSNYTNATEACCFGGVYNHASSVNVSGKTYIYGNLKNGEDNNVRAENNYGDSYSARVVRLTGKLTDGAHIGVTTWRIPQYNYSPEDFTSGFATYHPGENPSKYFSLDEDKAIMVFDGTGEAKVALKFTITLSDDGNGTASVTPADIYYDLHPTLEAKPNKGYVFKEWQVLSGVARIDKNNRITVVVEDSYYLVTDIQIKAVFEKQKFTVTFKDGTSTLSTATLTYGEKISKPNDPVKNGYRFNGWYSDPEFDHPFVFDSEIEGDTTIYANFIQEFTVSVTSGTADMTKAIAGETVTVTADTAPSGYVFDKWEAVPATVTFADPNSVTTTFNMPEGNVSIKATYVRVFSITMKLGTADKENALAGETVTITAADAPSGFIFDKWEAVTGTVIFADQYSATTTFTMPEGNVSIVARYMVNSGSCGEDMTWNIDEGGKLTISGTGAMQSWNSASDVPWVTIKDRIKEVVISDEVTAIEKNAFKGCTNLTNITIPGSVTSIGDSAFEGCTSLTVVTYGGTKEKWNSDVSIGSNNDALNNASIQYQKADNTFKVKGKTATVKYKKLKKKTQTLSVFKVLTFTNRGQGTLTYAKVSGSSKISINKTTGKVTIKKKGLKKKKTYSVKIKVMAAGNDDYNASTWKTVTFKIKVK